MTELKLEKRNLIVQLTEELPRFLLLRLGFLLGRFRLFTEQRRAALCLARHVGALRRKVGALLLLAVYRAKEESQLVQCRVEHNRVTDEVHVVRLDTFEIVEKRKPTQEDLNIINAKRQDAFAFDKPTRARKADKKAEPEEAKPS